MVRSCASELPPLFFMVVKEIPVALLGLSIVQA